ncbi:hypothetical protein G6F59_013655 [Rhizopus arrhizus]|nr:hypothetical protein G6F59_013655 [Rhizopus arrhizus]
MLASGIRLSHKHGFASVGVGDIQLAAGGQRQVFRDGALVIARLSRVDDGAVIGAVDGDGHVLRDHATIAVIDGHGKRLGERFTGLETLDVLVGVVQVVGPVARIIDRERAIRTLAAVVDGPGVRVGRVNVGDVDLAGSDQGAIFRDCAVSLAGQDGDIVGAHDRDHDLTGRAISRRNGEGLGQGLASAQALDSRVVIGQVIRPLAISIDGERAMLASGIRLGDKHGLTGIGVGHVELAAGSQRQVFRDGALVVARSR